MVFKKHNPGCPCCVAPPEPCGDCPLLSIWVCVCNAAKQLILNGAHQTWDVSECCDCAETPVELELWLTCEEVDPPTIPITYLLTLNWEFRCGDDTPQTGTVDVTDLCDETTILEDLITVTGCTFNLYASGQESDVEWCCADGCVNIPATGDALDTATCGANSGAPSDPDDQCGLFSAQALDGTLTPISAPIAICEDEEFTLFFVWDAGRNPETTADIVITIELPTCIGFEIGACEATYEDTPIDTVAGVVSWVGNTATITFSNVPALNEIQNTASIPIRVIGCCCELTDVAIDITIDHELDPSLHCMEWTGCT